MLTADSRIDLTESVAHAAETGAITDDQETHLDATDLIVRAQRQCDRATVWIAVEASNTIAGNDVDRARQSGNALHAVFGDELIAVAMGYSIRAEIAKRAKSLGVEVFILEDTD